ncbi:hypothetical protein NM688_g5125 [Phlebia brevispora]|uniref:Uncharacterized protein n=1 Tax=Phlebia brevispora TaxID=194682 RepID=A0ACC1T025_9APHY|nr:hypothetical protein NM688_g5125 [Phlebia brevispora]
MLWIGSSEVPETRIGFAWKHLPKGCVVADVAGGIKSHNLALAKAHEYLSFTIQYRGAVISDAMNVPKPTTGAVYFGDMHTMEMANGVEHTVEQSHWPSEEAGLKLIKGSRTAGFHLSSLPTLCEAWFLCQIALPAC